MVKSLLAFTFVLFFILTNISCNKEKKLSITYPSSGIYGENVLSLANNSNLSSVEGYSLCAELGEKAKLKIVITQISGSGIWFYAEGNGWLVGDYSKNKQQFESDKDGNIDLDIVFENGPGSCRIDYYENSSSVANSKTFIW